CGKRWSYRTLILAPARPFLPAAGDFRGEGVELVGPEAAEAVEPVVDIAQRRGVEAVDPARALWADGGKARLAENLEVLADRGLGDAELGGDDLHHLARGVLALGQQ